MNKSESIKEIATALCAFQRVIEGAKKGSTGQIGNQRYKYADLEAVWEAIREPLAANGMSVTQTFLESDLGRVIIETTLLHTSGEWIGGSLSMPMTKNDPQMAGSAITYGRRYALAAILGIYQEDDDGDTQRKGRDESKATGNPHSASTPTPPATGTPPPSGPAAPPAAGTNPAIWADIVATCADLGVVKAQIATHLKSKNEAYVSPGKTPTAVLTALKAKMTARAQAYAGLKARVLAKHGGDAEGANEEICVWMDNVNINWFEITPAEIMEACK